MLFFRGWLAPFLLSPEPEAAGGGNTSSGREGDISLESPGAPPLAGGHSTPPTELHIEDDYKPGQLNGAAPVKPADQQQAAPPEQKPDAPKWELDTLLKSIAPDLKPGDPRLQQFAFVKDMTQKVVKVNEDQAAQLIDRDQRITTYETEKADLTKQVAEAKAAVQSGTGSSADVVAAKAELKALQDAHAKDLAELTEHRAKGDLTNNPAFKQQYEGKMASLFEQAKATAEELKLDPTALDAVFAAKTELGVRTALDELELSPVAEKILTEKALEYVKLGQEKESLLNGKAGLKASELAEQWKAYHANLGGVIGQQFSEQLRGKLMGAVDEVAVTLGDKHPLFKTPHGGTVLDSIRGRFTEGLDLQPAEVVESLALAAVAPIYEKVATDAMRENKELNEKLVAAQAQIAQLTGNLPGNRGSAKPPVGGREAPARVDMPYQDRGGGDIVLPVAPGFVRPS